MQGVQIPQTQRQGNPADDPGTRVRHHGCYVKKDTRNEKRKDHCNIPDSACDSMFRPTWRCIRDTRIHVGEGCIVGGAEFYPASLNPPASIFTGNSRQMYNSLRLLHFVRNDKMIFG